MPKFHRHWGHRLGLEAIKIKHAMQHGGQPTQPQKDACASEISDYIDACYDYEKNLKLEDVYVTDHVPEDAKYVTGGGGEDEDYHAYQKSVDEYNSVAGKKGAFHYQKPVYTRGSLLQRMLDPFADSRRDEDGTIELAVTHEEVENFAALDDEKLRAAFEAAKAKDDVWDLDDEDDATYRLALMQELAEDSTPFTIREFDEVLDKELGVFKGGEEYDYVKDLKEAYHASLKTTAEARILATIPDHVFWDIKTPL